MTTIAEIIEEWNQEAVLTQKVLDALTDASLEQQVFPNGRTLGRLAWHTVTSIPEFLSAFGISQAGSHDTVPTSAQEIAETFRTINADVVNKIQELQDDSLKQVQNLFGREMTNSAVFSLLIKHTIHHRGQLTVLMRQAGLPVPGIYGPSLEEWGQIGIKPPAI